MSEKILWSNLPGISPVTKAYLEGHDEVVSLLGGNWRDQNIRKAVRDRRLAFQRPRGLGRAIQKSYGETKIPEAVQSNLDALNQPDTLAIVTGQQLGLFGGPLFTLYKALTAIFYARKLAHEAGVKVVPVFWMETADADYSEVNRVNFPPDNEELRRGIYTLRDIASGHSVRQHIFNSEIDAIRLEVLEWLKTSTYNRKYKSFLTNSYKPGVPLVEAFRDLMTNLLGRFGLIMFDVMDPALQDLTSEFWKLCLRNPERLNNSFNISSQELFAQRMPLQVRLRQNTLPIYRVDAEGIRYRLKGKSDAWYDQSDPRKYTNLELVKSIDQGNQRFSPGVLLRPLLQDWLLPTWIYVGGPAEIAYHAQIGRAYDQLELPRPLTAPRLSMTLIERPIRRILDKHNWKVAEVLSGKEMLLRTKGTSDTLETVFENGSAHLNGWLERIRQAADVANVNVSAELDLAGRKMSFQWDKLLKFTLNKVAIRDKTRVDHSQKVLNHLYPGDALQERHYSFLYFLAKYNDSLIRAIESEKYLFEPNHIVIDLEME